ncbi:hypothetical protein ACE3G8_04025 [Vreelandella venusta]
MQKPIEPGCMAIVTHRDFYGCPVRVVRRVRAGEPAFNGFLVEVDSWAVKSDDDSLGVGVFESRFLMRIDGGDPGVSQQETHDQEVPADVLA